MYSTLSHTLRHACFFFTVIQLGGLTTTSNTCNATFRPSVHYKRVRSGWATGTAILILYQSTVTITAVTDCGHPGRGQHVMLRLDHHPSQMCHTRLCYRNRNPRSLPTNRDRHSRDQWCTPQWWPTRDATLRPPSTTSTSHLAGQRLWKSSFFTNRSWPSQPWVTRDATFRHQSPCVWLKLLGCRNSNPCPSLTDRDRHSRHGCCDCRASSWPITQ